jgi:hypothetical protein
MEGLVVFTMVGMLLERIDGVVVDDEMLLGK